MLRSGRISAWGDLTSPVAKSAQGLAASFKAHTAKTVAEATGTVTIGSYNYYPGSQGLIADTLAGWLLNGWQLPNPTFDATWQTPVIAPDLPGASVLGSKNINTSVYTLREGEVEVPRYRTRFGEYMGWDSNGASISYLVSSHTYGADAFVVAAPAFTPSVPPTGKLDSVVAYGLGEVEVGVGSEVVKVHVGRGETDLNQVGMLTVRPDGFGTMRFDGSPSEFELLYEDNPAEYTDAPFGLPGGERSFDGATELTPEQTAQTGWETWFHYISAWHSPRLRQVRGGDILVDIEYPSSYRKILRFYWTKGLPASPTEEFYADLGNPFKVVVISNPTGPETGAGLTTTRFHLRIAEGKSDTVLQRFRDVILAPERDVEGALTKETFTFQEGASAGATTVQRTAEIQYGQDTTITTDEIFPGGSSNTVEVYHSGSSPRDVESPWLKLKSSTVTAGGETRTSTFTWNSPGGWLEQVDYTGPATWEMKDAQVKYSAKGQLSEITKKINGKTHRTEVSLTGNVGTRTEKLDGNTYRTEQITHSGVDWIAATTKVDAVTQSTRKFRSSAGSGGAPWSYAGADYPGGYKEEMTITGGLEQSSVTVKSGWGAQMANGSEETIIRGKYGELKNRTVTRNGVLVEKVDAIETETTRWGAPKQIKGLRNEITHVEYEETGIHWREVKSTTDPFGVQSTIGARDWLGRPSNWTNGHGETVTPNYLSFLTTNVASSIGHTSSSTTSVFGEPRSGSSTYGEDSSYSYNPQGGVATMTVGGKTKSMEIAADGVLKKALGGLGSRGGAMDFGVDQGLLYTEVTPLQKGDAPRTGKIRTFYDGQGRVKRIERPSHAAAGGTVTETWVYDDAASTVTHNPVPGAVPGVTSTVISDNGGTITVSVDGHALVRTKRPGGLTETTEIFDDTKANPGWVEMSRRDVNPAEGSVAFTPWGLAENGAKLVSSVPGANASLTVNETTVGAGRELMKLNLASGLPSSITDQADGVAKSLTLAHTNGHFTSANGTSGGEEIGLALDSERRIGSLKVPGGNKVFIYGGGQGSSVTITDAGQQTTNTITTDFVGDPVSRTGSGDVDLSFSVADDASKSKMLINDRLERTVNVYGEDLEKEYNGGTLRETFGRWPNGDVFQHSVIGQGGSLTTSIHETATERTVSYSDGLQVHVDQSRLGLPKVITQNGGQNERRKLEYERLSLTKETHEIGPLAGWVVEFVPDTRGRTGAIRATGFGLTREFALGYDTASRLQSSVGTYGGTETAAIAERNGFGKIASQTRRGLTTTWNRSVSYRLDGVTNVRGDAAFNYSYPAYDARHRIKSRVASRGTSWTGMSYDDKDQLQGVILSPGPNRGYGYDNRQNRVALQSTASIWVNYLDQAKTRTLLSPAARGFGLQGFVKPGSQLQVFNPYVSGGQANLSVHPQTGAFAGFWSLAAGPAAPFVIDALVRGTYVQPGAPTAIAEQHVFLRVPPMTESIGYDDAGRQIEDAYWTYQWDGASRLEKMVSKLPTRPDTTEVLNFTSDAQGRRTVKEHVLTKGETRVMTKSTMLWAGWLPLCEIRGGTGKPTTRRWFQWGPDISGTLDGAAGIGGLVAIHEENDQGSWKRTLLPIHDGIGNVTMVLDAATGAQVAQYDYGPFGEPLGETGEADACPFRWQTKYYDRETQLYYFPKRYYDPRTGRWLSRDSLGESGGFNLYAYCGNDPVNKYDPTGRAPKLHNSSNVLDVARINASGQPEVLYGDFTGFWSWFCQDRSYAWSTPSANDLARLFVRDGSGRYSVNTDPHSRVAVWNQQAGVAFQTIPDQVNQGLRQGALMTVAGVAAGFTGGASFALLTSHGVNSTFLAVAGSSIASGVVGDVTLQGGQILTHDRPTYDPNQTLNSAGMSLFLGSAGYGIAKFWNGVAAPKVAPVAPLQNSPIPGEIPETAHVILRGKGYYVLKHPNGTTIRFDAKLATQPLSMPATKTGFNNTGDTAAAISINGRVYVSEGLHRLNSVALEGDTVAESVLGAPGWLEYSFVGFTRTTGGPLGWGVPLNANPSSPKINPWEGLEGY